jgi:hypothetical protein
MTAGVTAEGNLYVYNPQTSRAAFVAPRSLEVASGFNLGEL